MGRKNISGLSIIDIITLILEPILLFWIGYFVGWLTKLIIGIKLITVINIVFETTFTADIFPIIGGVLGWIISFFKSFRAIKNNN